MPTDTGTTPAVKARVKSLPLRRLLPKLFFRPADALREVAEESAGEVIRLHLGPFRPYVVTHPDHVHRVLRANSGNYLRGGMFWKPLRPLFGSSILSGGSGWEVSRKALQPMFTARNINSLAGYLAETAAEAVQGLDEAARAGRAVNAATEMNRIVNKVVTRVFFGDKIAVSEVERLTEAIDVIGPSVVSRYLMPFMPAWFPMPGDRTFRKAVRTFDEVLFPLIHEHGVPDDGHDVFTVLCRARDASKGELTDQWVRDNLTAMFAAGTETTATTLTWLWPLLRDHPEAAARLYQEIDQVVRGGSVQISHLPHLTYTARVIQELLRLHPVGWLLSRVAQQPDVIGGVPIKPGETVLISPYVTHRLESVWDRPHDFDPDRFVRDRAAGRSRYAYFPFGGGPHQCMGMHVFNIESQLIVAGILSRYRPVFEGRGAATPQLGASLRPRQEIRFVLRPVHPHRREEG